MTDQWIHLFQGIADKKHIGRMGNSIWLYLYLLCNADRKTGMVYRKRETIAKDMGLPLKNVQRYLRRLREGGYIKTDRRQYSLLISITNWRPLPNFKTNQKKVKKIVDGLSGEMGQK